MQHPEEIKVADTSTLSSSAPVQSEWFAAVGTVHASRRHFAVLTESLNHSGFCIVEEDVTDHQLPPRLGSLQLLKMTENGTRYLGWLDDRKSSVNARSLLDDPPSSPKWTLIPYRSQIPDVENRTFSDGEVLPYEL